MHICGQYVATRGLGVATTGGALMLNLLPLLPQPQAFNKTACAGNKQILRSYQLQIQASK